MTTRDTRKAFLKLLDDTWPGVQSKFVAAMRQARAGVDMKALEAAIGRGDVDAAFRALRFDAEATVRRRCIRKTWCRKGHGAVTPLTAPREPAS